MVVSISLLPQQALILSTGLTGSTTEDVNGLEAGTYAVSVTDPANNCVATEVVVITEPDALVVTIIEDGSGSATANVSGGTPPYSYSWDNGQTSSTATGLSAGTATVTVEDANACTQSSDITIGMPEQHRSELAERVNIYPNPSTGLVQILVDANQSKGLEISVFNVLGESVFTILNTPRQGQQICLGPKQRSQWHLFH